jgi:hypothetical protein
MIEYLTNTYPVSLVLVGGQAPTFCNPGPHRELVDFDTVCSRLSTDVIALQTLIVVAGRRAFLESDHPG